MTKKAAKKVNGAAGPSGADSDMWQKLLCSKQHKKKPKPIIGDVLQCCHRWLKSGSFDILEIAHHGTQVAFIFKLLLLNLLIATNEVPFWYPRTSFSSKTVRATLLIKDREAHALTIKVNKNTTTSE